MSRYSLLCHRLRFKRHRLKVEQIMFEQVRLQQFGVRKATYFGFSSILSEIHSTTSKININQSEFKFMFLLH